MKSLRNITDESELAELVVNEYRRLKGDKDGDFERNKRYERIYLALDPPETAISSTSGDLSEERELYSHVYLPIGAALADTAVAQLYNQIFAAPRYARIIADDFEDALFAGSCEAQLMTRLKEMKFRSLVYSVLQQAVCFDYAVTFATWRIRPGYIWRRETTTENVKLGNIVMPFQETKMVQKWVSNAIDRPEVCMIDYFHCAHDCNARRGIEDSSVFVDWRWEDADNLQMLADQSFGKYRNIDAVLKDEDDIATPESDHRDRGSQPNKNRRMVIRLWTHDHVVEVAGKNRVISRTDISGMPIQLWKIYNRPGVLPGIGVLQRLERMQLDVNMIINLKRDFQNMALNGVNVIDSALAAGEKSGDITVYPGKTFINDTGRPPKDVFQMFYPGYDASQGATEELSVQIDTMKVVAGFDDNSMGQYTSGRKTARETGAVTTGVLSKTKAIAEKIETDDLEPIYLEIFRLEGLFMSQEKIFQYEGERGVEWHKIDRGYFMWNSQPRFQCRGSSYQAQQDMAIARFFNATQMQATMPQYAKWENIWAKMWQLLDPIDGHKMNRDPREAGHNVPPQLENYLLAQGIVVRVSKENNHQEHLTVHQLQTQTPDYKLWPEPMKMALKRHMMEHTQVGVAGQMDQPRLAMAPQDNSDMMRGQRGTMVDA